MSAERLELVTDFASLRASDLVVVKDCPWGDGEHRGLLLRLGANIRSNALDGPVRLGTAWITTIAAHEGRTGCTVISPLAVARRHIYRVIIPPADEARETARPKTVAKVVS